MSPYARRPDQTRLEGWLHGSHGISTPKPTASTSLATLVCSIAASAQNLKVMVSTANGPKPRKHAGTRGQGHVATFEPDDPHHALVDTMWAALLCSCRSILPPTVSATAIRDPIGFGVSSLITAYDIAQSGLRAEP